MKENRFITQLKRFEIYFNSKIRFLTFREIATILFLFSLTRLIILGIGALAFITFPQRGEAYYQRPPVESIDIEAQWAKFDSYWYLDLAQNGYDAQEFTLEEGQKNWAFMPLYPILIYLVATVTGLSYFFSGLLVSNISSFFAILILFKLVKEKFSTLDKGVANRYLAILLLSVGSYFLSIVYADGLFLLLTALVFYLSHKKWFIWAFFFVGLASVTRLQGILLGIIPFVELYMLDKKQFLKTLPFMSVALAPLGLLAYVQWLLTGNPLAFIDIQETWGAQDLIPLQGFFSLFERVGSVSLINSLFWGLYLTLYFIKRKQFPASYTLYLLAYFIISTGTEIVYGTTRYVLPLLPVFIAVSMYKPMVFKSVLYLNAILLGFAVAAFVTLSFIFI